MTTRKDVFMHAAIVMDKLIKDYLDFVITRRDYVTQRLMEASHIKEDTYEAVCEAVDSVLFIMRELEQGGLGDMTGHRLRQHRMAELKSIMHIARAFPDKALKRLKELPTKRLVNV